MIPSYAIQECAKLGVKLTKEQQWACVYLERIGKRFYYDFGYQNAVELARHEYPKMRIH